MIKALIFDNDGVLVDSEDTQIAAWQDFFRRYHRQYSDHELPRLTRGRPAREVIASVFPEAPAHEINKLAMEREVLHIAMLKKGMKRVAGIRQFLEEAHRAGFKLAVGTSAHRAKLIFMLTAVGLMDFFDVLITNDDVKHGKPAPDVFEQAARKMGMEKAECVVFEDAHNGVEAARRAGMKVIVLTTSHAKSEFDSSNIVAYIPDFTVKYRQKIMPVIKTLP